MPASWHVGVKKDGEFNVLQYVENYAGSYETSVLQKDRVFEDSKQRDELSSDSWKQHLESPVR